MANTTNNNEQIRQLTNRIHFAGILAELENVKEGTTTAGVPYLSFRGAIQCGESAVYTVKFRSFVKSKKSDGSDSKNFVKVKEWVKNAIPMTKDKEKATRVDAVGSITDNPYVNAAGTFIEGTEYSLQLFNDFKDYAAEIDLEGFMHSTRDETSGSDSDELTGRQRMRLITQDIYRNTLDIKNIVVPKELVGPLEENDYEKGCTAKFFITLMPNEEPAPAKTGGIGTQRTSGASYLEWVLTGADPVISPDSDKALDAKLIKAAMMERKSRLDEIKENGYLGNKTSSASSTTSNQRNSIGNSSSVSTTSDAGFTPISEDEDFPF